MPATSTTVYRVRWTILVDQPEKRDATFKPVPPGHRIAMERTYTEQGRALALFDELRGGFWDADSEYVSRLSVTAEDVITSGWRWVRREITRPARGAPLAREQAAA